MSEPALRLLPPPEEDDRLWTVRDTARFLGLTSDLPPPGPFFF
jgi:hypothetical protein